MTKNSKVLLGIIAGTIVVFLVIFGIISMVDNIGKSEPEVLAEKAVVSLKRYVDRQVNPTVKDEPIKGTVDLETATLEDELPSIDTYPFKVKGTGEIDIEIFSSPEKAGAENSTGSDEKQTLG